MSAAVLPDPDVDFPSRGLSPEWRTAVFYLTLFAPNAVGAVLSAVWFAQAGLSPVQIGAVNAAPLFVMLVLTTVVGRLADRAPDWVRAIRIAAMAAAAGACLLFPATGFVGILLAWTAMMVAHFSIVPVVDAAAMRMTARRGSDFGVLRAAGTVGYLVVLAAAGQAALVWGPAAFLPLLAGLAILRAALAVQLPLFRAGGDPLPAGRATRMRQVMRPWFVLPLAGWAAVFGTHAIINAFMGLMWRDQGIGFDMVGWLIAVSAVTETAVFFVFHRVAPLFRARTIILLSGVAAVIRWAGMATEPGLPVLFALQALHGLSYGMGFLACVAFIARWTSEGIAAEAQGFFTVMQQAMSMLSMFGFGWIMASAGAAAWWWAVGLAAAGTAAIFLSWLMPPPEGPVA